MDMTNRLVGARPLAAHVAPQGGNVIRPAVLAQALWRRKGLVLMTALLAALAAAVMVVMAPRTFTSTAQLLVWQLGRLKDQGTMHHTQVSLAKWNNVRMALDVARDARDLLGAGGITVETGPIRHLLNLESVITYEGTETIHQLIVGREITGVETF